MSLVQMTMQREAAHDTVESLGELGLIEFRDLNKNLNAFQRQYANEIRRCEELERKIRFFEEQLEKLGDERRYLSFARREVPAESLDAMESLFERHEIELRELVNNLQQMQKELNQNTELLEVLQQGERFFRIGPEDDMNSDRISNGSNGSGTAHLLDEEVLPARQGGLGFLSGVINNDKISTFLLLVYRATRGNMLPRLSEIPEPMLDPTTGARVSKSVFIVFFSAERARDKITKICESLGAHLYTFPEGDKRQIQQRLRDEISDLGNTIRTTDRRRKELLAQIAAGVESWTKTITKEKNIYHTMNLFDYKTSQHSVIAEGWCPCKALPEIRDRLAAAARSSGAQVSSYCEEIFTKDEPPTYFETNRFTLGFHNIVEAYGVARYKEANPAVFAIVTFPFLFSVMFGDVGHGLMLTMFAALLVIFEKKLMAVKLNEIVQIMFGGRYVLLLMGIFSIYTGMIYNDVMSLSFQWFNIPSGFTWPDVNTTVAYDAQPVPGYSFPFGIDPAWFGTTNKLTYYNSFKMKLAIILGVTHMMLGLFVSLLNHIRFKHYVDIFFEFIPEVLFLGCTFGYMCFIIIYKWVEPYPNRPSLLITMTNFFLSPHGLNETTDGLFAGQNMIQTVLLLVAVISVPFLLLPIPIIEWRKHKKSAGFTHQIDEVDEMHPLGGNNVIPLEAESRQDGHSKLDEHEEFQFSEVFIKQIIHTIEYVLGAVSNTASYLRLWALSLAHAQLADVFWQQIMSQGFSLESGKLNYTGIGIFAVFAFWFCATVGVLLIMESLSAFLHALRLHWVEFQNKFYRGDGHKFVPFSFAEIFRPKSGDE